MKSLHINRDSLLKAVLILSLYMVVASITLLVTLESGAFHVNDMSNRTSHAAYIEGICDRPFVCRALPAFLVRTAVSLTPDFVKEKIVSAWSGIRRLNRLDAWQGYVEGHQVEYLYTMLMMYASLIGIALIFRLLLKTFYDLPEIVAMFAPAIAIIFLPMMVSYFTYDFPDILLFSAGLLLLAQRRWVLYYPVFVLACLTKETAVLLPFIFMIDSRRGRGGRSASFYGHMAAQSSIWLAIYLGLRWIYAANGGGTVEFHLLDYNIPHLLHPTNYFRFSSVFLPYGLNLFMIAIVAILVAKDFREKSPFLKSALTITIPLLGLSLLLGIIDEIRNMFPLVPILFLLSVHTIAKLMHTPFRVKEGL